MKLKPIAAIITTLTVSVSLAGCGGFTGIKFNKAQWGSAGDLGSHPYREDMVEDLITHHQIKGLTYKQLIDSLGEPENYTDEKDSMRYDLVVDYGYLDPKSGKYLSIGFNKDSVATGFKVVTWHNRHVNEW